MFILNKNRTRSNQELYSNINSEFSEVGQKNGLYQGYSPANNIVAYWNQQTNAASMQQSWWQSQATIKAQEAGVAAQAQYAGQIKSGEYLGALIAHQQLSASGMTLEQILDNMGLSASFQAMQNRANENEKLLASLRKNSSGASSPSKDKFLGFLADRMKTSADIPSYLLPVPSGYEEGFYFRIPEAKTKFEGGDLFGAPIPKIEYESYSRAKNGDYIFLQEDGTERIIPASDVMKKVSVPGGERGAKIIDEDAWLGPVPFSEATQAQKEATANWGTLYGPNYNEYYIQADEAMDIKYNAERMNEHAHAVYSGLTAGLNMENEDAYLVANSIAEKGFMGGLVDLVFVLLSKSKSKDKNFKDADSWRESVGGKPKIDDVITLIESLPPDVKGQLDDLLIIEDKIVNGKSQKVIKINDPDTNEHIELTESQARVYTEALIIGDEGRAKELADKYVARAKNTPLNKFFEMIDYDVETDNVSLTGGMIEFTAEEIRDWQESLEVAGMTATEMFSIADLNKDVDPRRYALAQQFIEKVAERGFSDGPIKLSAELKSYDKGGSYQYSQLENLEMLAQSLESANERKQRGI